MNALHVRPPFMEYHFIDLVEEKVKKLEDLVGEQSHVTLHHGDCNDLLLERILPRVRYREFRRALCVLDPYGLHLDWRVIQMAGRSEAIEIFLNFPVLDMNRNVFWRNPEAVPLDKRERMTRFWGDESWMEAAYKPSSQMSFLASEELEKRPTEAIVQAFKRRLKTAAGFKYVTEPIAVRTPDGHTLYYLFFASPNPTANKIVNYIFDKYRT